jgi:hypothetical protein
MTETRWYRISGSVKDPGSESIFVKIDNPASAQNDTPEARMNEVIRDVERLAHVQLVPYLFESFTLARTYIM